MKRRAFLRQAAGGVLAGAVADSRACADGIDRALAAGDQLAEEPRRDARRRRRDGPARDPAQREEVRDPVVRRRRDRAAAAGARRGAERHDRVRPHADLVLHRQEPGLRVRRRPRLRAQHPPAERLDVLRRRPRAHARHVREGRRLSDPVRQCRRADGRLLPQGDQLGRRPQGTQVPHRRARRHDPVEARRRAAADPDRRHLSVARARHDRRRRVDRALRRREARPAQGREVLLHARLVGGQRPGHAARQPAGLGGAVRSPQGHAGNRRAPSRRC